MKPIALAVVILIGIFLQAQTIKETADWLSSFVAKKATVIDRAGNWRDTYTVELNESKQLIITHQTNDLSCFKPENRDFCPSSHEVYTTTFKQQVNLSDIDPKSIGYHG